MATVPQFRTGVEEAEKAAARRSFIRTDYLKIEDGSHAIVRMLTDHDRLITVLQHNNPPTREKAADYTGKWPQSMPAVCRNDKAFAEMYHDCFLCNRFAETGDKRQYKPAVRSWALAVLRKKKMVDGRFIGFEDATKEITVDEKKVTIPQLVTVNYAWGNFWDGFTALTQMNGTWLDRELHITRKGKELDSSYSIAPYDRVGVDGMGKFEGDALDMRNYEHARIYVDALGLDSKQFDNSADPFFQALMTLVSERATDEFYARFFDTRVAQPTSSVVPEDAHEKVVNDEPSEEELAALMGRVQDNPGGEKLATLGFG